MPQAILNIRVLLFKWALSCVTLAILMVALVAVTSSPTNKNIASAQRLEATNIKAPVKPKGKITTSVKNKQTLLPPFKSESDIEAVKKKKASVVVIRQASSNGNTYSSGYCTWYAKSRRPDLPNNLGNANTWFARASAQGIPTGSKPKVGAVGQRGNHVVFVEKINQDGTITISEMNYRGFNKTSKRIVSADNFRYIY